MENIVKNLNYDFNLLLHVFNRNFRDYRDRLSASDQILAVKWVNKLKSEGQSLEGAQLRNDLLNYLSKSVECGCLKSPFDQKPPHGHLLSIKDILPREMKTIADNAPRPSHPKPEIFERSPDKGAFLAAQPVPRSGAFCYLAIVSRAPNCN